MRRSSWWISVAGAFGLLAGGLPAAADVVPPANWPATSLAKPMIEGWPNALRIYGDNRYQTGLAASLVLHGEGEADSYPFGDPDPATDNGWWGLDTCPRAIIVVAGDSPADALAASSLSDPTGQSTEPFLQRSAAADPLFFPPGGFARVDTDFAPILVTRSARQGASQLDIATRLAAQDLRNGGCSTARQAIVIGGTRAIASTVDSELVSIGYDEVFRVAGATRYATARLIAESLGTAESSSTDCFDVYTNDNDARARFYANSVVEYRTSSTACRLLQRSAILADGVYGVDALAAGWWASYWQVPILLHDGTDDLPRQTSEALQTLDVDSLIVLGGQSRVSDEILDEARTTSGARDVIRISGANRYATSVEMAKYFGGWWPSADGADFEASMLCLAASSGGSPTSVGVGWADALSSGPWCGRASASPFTPPARALSPVDGPDPVTTESVGPPLRTHDFVPVILVPAGSSTVSRDVDQFLQAVFPASDGFCDGDESDPGCLAPGFALVFGGPVSVSATQVGSVSARLGASARGAGEAPTPVLDEIFVTRLDMGPVFHDSVAGEGLDDVRLCALRGQVANARWLVTHADSNLTFDLIDDRIYAVDADGEVRSRRSSTPFCVAVDEGDATAVALGAVSASGRSVLMADRSTYSLLIGDFLGLDGDLGADTPTATDGIDSVADEGETAWTFVGIGASPGIVSRGDQATVTAAEITISLLRGGEEAGVANPDTFEASFEIETSEGSIEGRVEGEAVFQDGVWFLRGAVEFGRGSWNVRSGSGGFRAEIDTLANPGSGDDALEWRVDGLV